jgi:hypothetical protein
MGGRDNRHCSRPPRVGVATIWVAYSKGETRQGARENHETFRPCPLNSACGAAVASQSVAAASTEENSRREAFQNGLRPSPRYWSQGTIARTHRDIARDPVRFASVTSRLGIVPASRSHLPALWRDGPQNFGVFGSACVFLPRSGRVSWFILSEKPKVRSAVYNGRFWGVVTCVLIITRLFLGRSLHWKATIRRAAKLFLSAYDYFLSISSGTDSRRCQFPRLRGSARRLTPQFEG